MPARTLGRLRDMGWEEADMNLGVDFANYTPVPTPPQLQCWWDGGVRFAIVGCQRADVAAAHLRALNADGRFGIEAYQFYLWDDEDEARTDRALVLMREAGCRRLWVDVEWDEAQGPEPGAERVLPRIGAAVQQIESRGLEAGIYTSARYWPSMAANSQDFKRLPLWHAAYSQRYSVTSLPDFGRDFAPYGGWGRPLIWQWAGSVQMCGLNVDMNASDAEIGRRPAGSTPVPACGYGIMTRFNSSTFRDQVILGRVVLNLTESLGLPHLTRMVRLEVSLARPSYVGVGDGEGGAYAGSLRDGETHGVIDVLPSDGNITLDAPDGASLRFVGVVGYWA